VIFSSPDHFRALSPHIPKFPSLKEGQIPIFPQDLGFSILTMGKPRTKIHC
jgi:hypothetical protein